ncbi:MAG: LOG family protein [Vulcanimicrobiota bacterium]
MRPDAQQARYFNRLAKNFVTQLNNDIPHKDLIERMLASVLRMSGDARRTDLKLTTASLEEMEHSFDVLEEHSLSRKAVLFGSARSAPDDPVYIQAREFSRRIVEEGYMVITGAGPGVMAAGNEGAGRENSFGMGIALPFETDANEFIIDDPKMIMFKYFFTRKLAFLKDSHAVILCPGGFGTLDEGFEVLTLIQTGKAQLLPVVFLQPPGYDYWEHLTGYVENALLEKGMISPADQHLYLITDSVDEACREVVKFYRRYHSMRFEGEDLFLRLSEPLPEGMLEALNQEFGDLLVAGKIEATECPPDPSIDPNMKCLPHLKLRFDLAAYGRLRLMIDRINEPETTQAPPPPEKGEGGRMPVETDTETD